LAPCARGHLFAGETFDDTEAAFYIRAKSGTNLRDDGSLVAVGYGNLLTGRQHQLIPLLFTVE
jgi:hypothetical protein